MTEEGLSPRGREMISVEEKVLPGPLGPDPLELYKWRPPNVKKVQTEARIRDLCFWVLKTLEDGPVGKDEITVHASMRFNISLASAERTYTSEVLRVMRRKGVKVE